mgnify:CR=1 FL=1
MKTSNKLLIGFTSLLVLLMLCTDIVLRANFSKGITNVHFTMSDLPQVTEPLPAFRIIQVVKAADSIRLQDTITHKNTDINGQVLHEEVITYAINHLNIHQSDAFSITKRKGDSVTTRISGDTLLIFAHKPGNININCPGVAEILSHNYNVSVNDMKVPALKVITGPSTEASFHNNQIGNFSFSGGIRSSLEMDDNNHLDSLHITLEKASKLNFSADYKHGNFEIDSLREINFSGKSVQQLKQIK